MSFWEDLFTFWQEWLDDQKAHQSSRTDFTALDFKSLVLRRLALDCFFQHPTFPQGLPLNTWYFALLPQPLASHRSFIFLRSLVCLWWIPYPKHLQAPSAVNSFRRAEARFDFQMECDFHVAWGRYFCTTQRDFACWKDVHSYASYQNKWYYFRWMPKGSMTRKVPFCERLILFLDYNISQEKYQGLVRLLTLIAVMTFDLLNDNHFFAWVAYFLICHTILVLYSDKASIFAFYFSICWLDKFSSIYLKFYKNKWWNFLCCLLGKSTQDALV